MVFDKQRWRPGVRRTVRYSGGFRRSFDNSRNPPAVSNHRDRRDRPDHRLMPLIFADDGDLYLLEQLRQKLVIAPPRLFLYQNDITPAHDSAISDFLECTFGGYPGNQPLFFANPAALNLDGKAQINAQLLVYASTGAGLPQR